MKSTMTRLIEHAKTLHAAFEVAKATDSPDVFDHCISRAGEILDEIDTLMTEEL